LDQVQVNPLHPGSLQAVKDAQAYLDSVTGELNTLKNSTLPSQQNGLHRLNEERQKKFMESLKMT
jgi:hypothetical protein